MDHPDGACGRKTPDRAERARMIFRDGWGFCPCGKRLLRLEEGARAAGLVIWCRFCRREIKIEL